jgi:solute carrier family 8 (sodium/calcium exchanger)
MRSSSLVLGTVLLGVLHADAGVAQPSLACQAKYPHLVPTATELSVDGGVQAVQTVVCTSQTNANTFTLNHGGVASVDIPFNANAATVEAAFQGMSTVGDLSKVAFTAGNTAACTSDGSNTMTFTFEVCKIEALLTAVSTPVGGVTFAAFVSTVTGKAGAYGPLGVCAEEAGIKGEAIDEDCACNVDSSVSLGICQKAWDDTTPCKGAACAGQLAGAGECGPVHKIEFAAGNMYLEYKPDSLICEGGMFIPFFAGEFMWGSGVHIFLYFITLIYSFFGIAIIADIFMAAIEVITSKTKTLTVTGKDGQSETVEYLVWNATIANLTLMALGSSAPEILLSVIETLSLLEQDVPADGLGPGTIVGSAAFNLLVIIGLCVMGIPSDHVNGPTRKVANVNVFLVTSTYSVLAYILLFLIVKDDQVKLWEAVVTFLLFPVLVIHCFWTEQRGKNKVTAYATGTDGMGATGYGKDDLTKRLGKLSAAQALEGLQAEAAEGGWDKSQFEKKQKELARLAALEIQSQQPVSAIKSKINARRQLTGQQRVLVTAPKNSSVVSDLKAKGDAHGEVQAAKIAMEEGVAYISFASPTYAVEESKATLEVHVIREGHTESEVVVAYATEDGSALSGADYVHTNGTLTFAPGVVDMVISVPLIDDNDYEPDEFFFVHLRAPKTGNKGNKTEAVKLGSLQVTQCTILNDDNPGTFSFAENAIAVNEADKVVKLEITRTSGCDGEVKVLFSTQDVTAIGGSDFIAVTEQEVLFKHGQTNATVEVTLIEDDEFEKEETFNVVLELPGSPDNGTVYGDHKQVVVTIIGDEGMASIVEGLAAQMADTFDACSVETTSIKEQFLDAVQCTGEEGEEPSTTDYVMHFITIGWKVIFALVPPTHLKGGWVTFFVALAFVGVLTGFVADIAGIFGCLIGLPKTVTAITFVALGTSLPDTFASLAAARNDKTADNAVGNVTGSNSVNVFLGLGLPWLIATITHTASGFSPEIKPNSDYKQGKKLDKGSFGMISGSLGFSVVIFCICAIACFIALWYKRATTGAELGGAKGKTVGWFCVTLWLVYVSISSLEATGSIKSFI